MDKKQAQKKAMDVVNAYCDKKDKKSDPNGSYTGQPENRNEVPVQDADDL